MFGLTLEQYIWLMIILDALIATLIPPYMVWRRAIAKQNEIADKFGIPIAKKAFAAIQPEAEKSLERVLLKFENSVESRINTHITNVINNDVKHLIEDQVNILRADLPDREEMKGLTTAFRAFTSASGVLGKAQHAAEDQAIEMALYKQDPEKFKQLQLLKFFAKKAGMPKSQVRDLIQIQMMTKGGLNAPETEFPIRPEGPAVHIQTAPKAQEESNAEETVVGPVVGPKTDQKEARNEIEKIIGKDQLELIEKGAIPDGKKEN